MTNEELKKKIERIIGDVYVYVANASIKYLFESFLIEKIADALIGAGVVDKSDYASMKETAVKYKAEVSKAENRAKEAEHRAARAEKALRIFAEDCSCADCPFFGGCDIVLDAEDDFSCCFDMYLAIAEKELAEEEKDDRTRKAGS